jgi:hypothetical protein
MVDSGMGGNLEDRHEREDRIDGSIATPVTGTLRRDSARRLAMVAMGTLAALLTGVMACRETTTARKR